MDRLEIVVRSSNGKAVFSAVTEKMAFGFNNG
jgi:hypothetical protein